MILEVNHYLLEVFTYLVILFILLIQIPSVIRKMVKGTVSINLDDFQALIKAAEKSNQTEEKYRKASKELSVFVGLIITNCIIMGRLEAFALGNTVWKSFLDGIGNAFGYAWILLAVAFFRELLGSGTLFGFQIIPDAWYLANGGFYSNNGFMLLPPMALITVGIIIWVQRARNTKLIEE